MTFQLHRGFTLIELLLVITILSITLGIGAPSMSKIIESSHRKSTLNQLMTGISFARTEAITKSTNITLCPLDDSNRCSRDWTRPITIFTDPTRLRKLGDNSIVLKVLDAPEHGKLYGRTGIRRHFGFRPTGMARASIGHLLWCPDNGDEKRAFQIRINMGGRPLIARDHNGDGIVEDTYGRNITCP